MDSKTKPLPPYRSLLIVDVTEFSTQRGIHHAEVTESIPEILEQTFQRCGLATLWSDAKFQISTGDGYAVGFAAKHLPFLLHPFLPALQDELAYRADIQAVSGRPQPLRMRVSVNVGPMTDSGAKRISDGSGDARIENHRLLDSGAVRGLLSRSGPTTRVGAIVSKRAFDDAVVSGFVDDDPNDYVLVDVAEKQYRGQAYLRVPKLSGELLRSGLAPAAPVTEPAERRTGVGAIHGDVGNVFHQASGPINASNHGSRRRRDER